MTNFAPQMEIVYYNSKTKIQPKCAATIGVFDGVHAGHQHVINEMKHIAKHSGRKSMVITFDRQPRELFDPDFHPQVISTMEEKAYHLKMMEVDYLVVLPFTMRIAQLTAREFMQQVLRRQLNVEHLTIGYDHRFGSGRKESFNDYEAYGEELGITLFRSLDLRLPGFNEPVSSSLIRRLITEEGRVNEAAVLLTRPYRIVGTVVPGEHIGTKLGFPTANLEPEDDRKLIPASGAYVVITDVGEDDLKFGMMNVGTRPTFNGSKCTLEVNIFDYDGDLYDREIAVCFAERLREERHFTSPEALKAQLKEDKKQALEFINRK